MEVIAVVGWLYYGGDCKVFFDYSYCKGRVGGSKKLYTRIVIETVEQQRFKVLRIGGWFGC